MWAEEFTRSSVARGGSISHALFSYVAREKRLIWPGDLLLDYTV